MLAWLFAAVVVPQGPIDFGRARLDVALSAAGLAAKSSDVAIAVGGPGAPESFALSATNGKVRITAPDQSGAMYGALELAERIRLRGASALADGESRHEPYLRDRGWNVFLTLPWDYERNVTVYDESALTDARRWWFQDEQYWTSLFDLMAESRLNWLDLHGMWDIDVTDAPNLYAYFVDSERFPEVGPASAVKAACLARLRWVIDKAHERGVRVSLMSYEARLKTPHRKTPPYPNDDQTAAAYTREVVTKLIKALPGLDMMGFRIGESGRGESFFECYLAAVKDSGREIPLLARTWLARKSKVLPLARASSDLTLEIKFNGEQWGPPYMVAGGRMANWYSYSFEDYLSDSGPGVARKLWPGNPTGTSTRWPDQPYKIAWQVRVNGTHRVFPFYEPEWVRRSVGCMRLGTASGFSVEPLNAFYPAESRFLTAGNLPGVPKWVHQRDELFLNLWGRLGYDPRTDEAVFISWFTTRFGPAGAALARTWKLASQVVPRAFTAYSLGPDHRNHAPELEWGGGTDDFVTREPFDSHVFRSIKEDLAYRWTGGRDGRRRLQEALTPLARLVPPEPVAAKTEEAKGFAEFVRKNLVMLIALRDYYAARFAGAERAALAECDMKPAGDLELASLGEQLRAGVAAWRTLAESTWIRPFSERLRMRSRGYHWRDQLAMVEQDAQSVRERAQRASGVLDEGPGGRVGALPDRGKKLEWAEVDGTLVVSVSAEGLTSASLLSKPLPSSTFFHKAPMLREGDRFVARVPVANCGLQIAAELENGAGLVRIPDWEVETPYLVVPARPGPTPLFYSSGEALTYLEPEVLTPEKHGLLLLCPRSWCFHRYFDVGTQRKVLDAVARGMTLLVMQQDYLSGRYPLAWLPNPPKLESCNERTFDPAGALGLPKITSDGMIWQRFVPTPGWQVFGNGGIAKTTHGKGTIWMVQARLMQRMHVPECARAMKAIVEIGGKRKPVVLIDVGSEGGEYGTSVWPDFLNAHDIPFLTLGEIVAQEQGPNATTPIPGRIEAGSILAGKGAQILKGLYEAKAKESARHPVPASRELFESWRARTKLELRKSLGLDPMPERTPLEAQVTGTIQRDGYRIEKVVFQSRPGFPVTAHLYVPDGLASKAAVIVNPHGHWQHKKQESVVQMRAIAQAKAGYVAIVVDSPGFSFEGKAKVERREAGPHDDYKLLLGSTNTTGIYVWDLMRALDYLATRPECDMTRIGITGASGGGLATLYAFAADERYSCAVPVVYATSMEVNPYNGCLCNHVPAALQLGDRADVLALRAPLPVLVIGAEQDGEFPPAGTDLTGKKLKALWSLFGASAQVRSRVFPGPHDYNQAMREEALGFFDLHLRALGDGKPRKEPKCEPLGNEDPALFVGYPQESAALTMRQIAERRLAAAGTLSFAEVLALEGGMPELPKTGLLVVRDGKERRLVTIPSERGLTVPGVLLLPKAAPSRCMIVVDDRGAAVSEHDPEVLARVAAGDACLCLDARGTGELASVDLRLLAYLGSGVSFAMAVDVVQAARSVRDLAPSVEVVGRGKVAAQAALFAGLMEPAIATVHEVDGLRELDEAFRADVPAAAVHPRAALGIRLAGLRKELGARLKR